MGQEYSKGRWFELIFGLTTGAFFGALGTVYLISEKDSRVAKKDNYSIETALQTTRKNDAKTRTYLIDNAEKFLMYGNPDYARKNIDHFLSLNPTDEERLQAFRLLDRIATNYRENNKQEQCAKIYEKVSELAPGKADEILDKKNIDFAKAYGKTEEPR